MKTYYDRGLKIYQIHTTKNGKKYREYNLKKFIYENKRK